MTHQFWFPGDEIKSDEQDTHRPPSSSSSYIVRTHPHSADRIATFLTMPDPIYLDNAATTPVRPEVRQAIAPFLGDEGFGNPSSAHQFGRTARAAVEQARQSVATALGAKAEHVVFTSGGTEADNLAVLGGALAARSRGAPFHVAVSAIEHKAVLDAAKAVEAMGGRATVLPVDESGAIELNALTEALADGVAVLSALWVNNEIGAVQDVTELARICQEAGALFHSDAVQAVGKVPCSLDAVPGVDSSTLLMHLDLAGICCSSGSACNTGTVTASHVLTAMGVPNELAVSAVRFSFSKHNTEEDVQRVFEVLPPLVTKLTQA